MMITDKVKPGHGMEWNGRRFFHIPNWQFSSIPFPFHTKNLPFHISFHTKIFFHIPLHTSIPKKFKLESMQRIFCCFNTKMQRPVSGMHIARGLMHRRSLNFLLGGGLNRKSYNDVVRSL